MKRRRLGASAKRRLRAIMLFIVGCQSWPQELAAAAPPLPFARPVCVSIDVTRDELTEDDRKGALIYITRAFQENQVLVTDAKCASTFTLHHRRTGAAITIFLAGPTGTHQATASSAEYVSTTYYRVVQSLLTGSEPANDPGGPAEGAPAPPLHLLNAGLGFGHSFGDSTNGGPAFGIGYRHQQGSLAADVSILNFAWSTAAPTGVRTNDDGTRKYKYTSTLSGSWIKVLGLWFTNPHSRKSLYGGFGVSWGRSSLVSRGTDYYGSGMQGELALGWEFLRTSRLRLFSQVNTTLPFYRALRGTSGLGPVSQESIYSPLLVWVLGAGWGPASE